MPEGIPQLEDGFTRIANEILEAIARTPLSDYESRCVHFLWRKTYGWQNPDGQSKKVDVISHTQWAEGTDIPRWHIDRVLTRLAKRKIITKQEIYRGARRIILWGFKKRYKEWLSPKQVTLQSQLSPNQVTGEVSPKEVTDKAELSPKQVTSPIQLSPIQGRVSPKQVTISSPKQVHTKDNKDTPTKERGAPTTTELKMLEILRELKGWRYGQADDLAWLRDFRQEFPDFDLSQLRAARDYYSGKPPPKHKGGWKNRFRNWMLKKREFKRKEHPGPRGKSFEQFMKEQEGS
jgi:phage replication O-like protein O